MKMRRISYIIILISFIATFAGCTNEGGLWFKDIYYLDAQMVQDAQNASFNIDKKGGIISIRFVSPGELSVAQMDNAKWVSIEVCDDMTEYTGEGLLGYYVQSIVVEAEPNDGILTRSAFFTVVSLKQNGFAAKVRIVQSGM
jgi:hypothetical protein